jgi:hypothetical protein
LKELSLNRKYEQLKKDELSGNHAALLRSLKKEKAVSRQIEIAKEKALAKFDELIKFNEKRFPGWLAPMIWAFQDKRVDRAQKAITKIEVRLKKHTEGVIEPLLYEIDEMNEEIKLRVNLGTN